MKRFSVADLILMVGVGAMTAYFVRAGINFRRRSFTTTDIAIAIGAPVASDVVGRCLAVVFNRRRRESVSQ